jgi:hypothetical protein
VYVNPPSASGWTTLSGVGTHEKSLAVNTCAGIYRPTVQTVPGRTTGRIMSDDHDPDSDPDTDTDTGSGRDDVEDVPDPSERPHPDDPADEGDDAEGGTDDVAGDGEGLNDDDTAVDDEEWVEEEHEGPDDQGDE